MTALPTQATTNLTLIRSFRARFAHAWTLRGGKAVRFEQFVDTTRVRDVITF
jgi:ketosteroid isomerase-like protein